MPMRPETMLALLTVGALALAAHPATARPVDAVANRTAVAQAISDCRKIADGEARLTCYDKAVDAFDTAQAQGQVVVVDRAQVREVKRQAFGFSLPSLNLFSRGPKEEVVDKVTVRLSGAHKNAIGKWAMPTEDDAVWSQTDDTELYNPPRAGSVVAIRRAMLGSYFCNVDGQTAFRCTRTQ